MMTQHLYKSMNTVVSDDDDDDDTRCKVALAGRI